MSEFEVDNGGGRVDLYVGGEVELTSALPIRSITFTVKGPGVDDVKTRSE